MDRQDYEALTSGDVAKSAEVLRRFVAQVGTADIEIKVKSSHDISFFFFFQYSNTFDFTVFNQYGQWTPIWNAIFQLIRLQAQRNDVVQILPDCLAAIRLLSRDKTYLNQTISSEQFESLLNIANIGSHNVGVTDLVICVEALKCLCNLVFQSTNCQEMCLKNAAIEGIVKRLRTYK